jgi:hypothetical protein
MYKGLTVAAITAFASMTGVQALDPVGPTWLEGTCPDKSQNKEDFDKLKFAGLWFEYTWEDHFATGLDHYVCSSFIVLEEGTGNYLVYNSLQFPAEQELWALNINQRLAKGLPPFSDEELERQKKEEEEGKTEEYFNPDELERESTFMAYKMHYQAVEEGQPQRAKLSIVRNLEADEDSPANEVPDWSKHLQIIDTDYHSYAVALHCEDRTNPDTGAAEHTEDYVVLTREKQPSMYMRRRARNALLADGVSEERISKMHKGKIFECWGKDYHY